MAYVVYILLGPSRLPSGGGGFPLVIGTKGTIERRQQQQRQRRRRDTLSKGIVADKNILLISLYTYGTK